MTEGIAKPRTMTHTEDDAYPSSMIDRCLGELRAAGHFTNEQANEALRRINTGEAPCYCSSCNYARRVLGHRP